MVAEVEAAMDGAAAGRVVVLGLVSISRLGVRFRPASVGATWGRRNCICGVDDFVRVVLP
jgi:hypothetical protein